MKYKLTTESIEICGHTLFRIECVTPFGNIQIGEKGGFIEKEDNLSQSGDAWVSGNARVCGDAWVSGNARVCGNAWVFGNARVCGNAWVFGKAWVSGNARVCGDAWVSGNAKVSGNAEVCGKAEVKDKKGYIVFKNWWSSGRYFTWTSSNDKWKVGCFFGTGEELIAKAYKDSEVSGREYERIVKYVDSIKDQFKEE